MQKAVDSVTDGRIDADAGAELHQRALELVRAGKFAEALTILQDEEEICRRQGQDSELAQCLCNQGMALVNLGEPETALTILEKVRMTAQANGDADLEARALVNAASALRRIPGRRMETIQASERSLELARSTGSQELVSRIEEALQKIFSTGER